MTATTSQGAVDMQSNAENDAARSASKWATVPGSVPKDITKARCQATRPSAMNVLSSATSDKMNHQTKNESPAHGNCTLQSQVPVRNRRTILSLYCHDSATEA